MEVGGGLRTYTAGGLGRSSTATGEGETCFGRSGPGAHALAEPAGRRALRVGRPSAGRPHSPSQSNHNAIHGLVRWAPWTVAEETPDRARLEYRLYPQPGWPWILDLAVTYSLSDDGLEVRTTAVNLPGGAGPCPFGAGWHPYLAAFGGLVDDAVLTFGAGTTYVSDERGLPVRHRARRGQRPRLQRRPADRRGPSRHGVHRPGPRLAGRAIVELPRRRRIGPRYPAVDGSGPTPT